MEFKPNLFWWIVSVVLLSPQLGVHLKLYILQAIDQMLLTSNFNLTWKCMSLSVESMYRFAT